LFVPEIRLVSEHHVTVSLSMDSILVLKRIQKDVTGLAFSRLIEISSPQSSQIPYSPVSIAFKKKILG